MSDTDSDRCPAGCDNGWVDVQIVGSDGLPVESGWVLHRCPDCLTPPKDAA